MSYSLIEMAQGICPVGWHIPSDYEFNFLIAYLLGEDVAGGKMKSIGTIQDGDGLWEEPNAGATNESGFTALPAGYRTIGGGFSSLGTNGYFWSTFRVSGNIWIRRLNNTNDNINKDLYGWPNGLSVRCIQDY